MADDGSNREATLADLALLEQAERRCRERLAREPEDRVALRSLADIHRKLGHLDEAAAAYGRLHRLDPGDQEVGYLQAVMSGAEWAQGASGLRAAPFVLLRDFLPRDLHGALLPFFASRREQFVPVKQNNEYRPHIRQTLEFPGEWAGRARFSAAVTAVLGQVVPRLYLPPWKTALQEVQVRAYQDGHFFKTHRDADPDFPGADRVVNFVYFFHRRPRPYSGGELLLFDSEMEVKGRMTTSRFTRVVPEDNSIIFFPSNFYHCVLPTHCASQDFLASRFVINGHFHKCPAAGATVGAAAAHTGPATES